MSMLYQRPVTFRPVTLADAPALWAACWPGQRLADVELRLTDVVSRRARGLTWGYAVVVEGIVIGYGQIGRWGRRVEISDLMLSEGWRGRGIGTQLITFLLGLARIKGFHEVEIGVAGSNPRALALYRRLSFSNERSLTLDLGDGPEPAIYLMRQLVQPVSTSPGHE